MLDSSVVADNNPFLKRPKVEMSADDQKLFLESIDRSLELTRERLKLNPDDIDALYAAGVAYSLRADYDFAVKKAWLAALRDFTQTRKYHARVTRLDPNRVDALLTQGLYTYVAGSLGFPWKTLGLLAGFHGDKAAGIQILRRVADEGQYNRADAAMLLEAIYRREHRSAEAVPYIQDLIRWFPRNYIFRMEFAQLYADLGEKDKSLAVVSEVEQLKKKNAPGFGMLSDARLKDLRVSVEQQLFASQGASRGR